MTSRSRAALHRTPLPLRFATAEVADAFRGSRLGTSYDGTYGTLTSSTIDLRAIVERATPVVSSGGQ